MFEEIVCDRHGWNRAGWSVWGGSYGGAERGGLEKEDTTWGDKIDAQDQEEDAGGWVVDTGAYARFQNRFGIDCFRAVTDDRPETSNAEQGLSLEGRLDPSITSDRPS